MIYLFSFRSAEPPFGKRWISLAQTTVCSLYENEGCFVFSQGSCDSDCACYVQGIANPGNQMLILSCSEGFEACCGCCSQA